MQSRYIITLDDVHYSAIFCLLIWYHSNGPLGAATWGGDSLTALTGNSYGSPPAYDCLSSLGFAEPFQIFSTCQELRRLVVIWHPQQHSYSVLFYLVARWSPISCFQRIVETHMYRASCSIILHHVTDSFAPSQGSVSELEAYLPLVRHLK